MCNGGRRREQQQTLDTFPWKITSPRRWDAAPMHPARCFFGISVSSNVVSRIGGFQGSYGFIYPSRSGPVLTGFSWSSYDIFFTVHPLGFHTNVFRPVCRSNRHVFVPCLIVGHVASLVPEDLAFNTASFTISGLFLGWYCLAFNLQ